jgi:SAM-dependent methyltransferase
MGLAKAAVHLLMTEASRRPFRGSVVTLGRQHVYVTSSETQHLASKCGVALKSLPVELHREPSLAKRGFVSDDWLFKSLGFDEIVRVDYSDYESSEVILDLNDSETPGALRSRFDLVLDSGTLEHVFDFAAGLRHCVRMVRPGGRVIHLTPSSNCAEHGFYSVSPTLYSDFYAASGFSVDRVWLCEIPLDLPRGDWNVYDYAGSSERFISLGQLSDKIWFTFSVATAEGAVSAGTPQQWIYTQTWSKADKENTFDDTSAAPNGLPAFEDGSRSQWLIQKLSVSKSMQVVATKLIRGWRDWRHQSRVRNRKLPYPFLGVF